MYSIYLPLSIESNYFDGGIKQKEIGAQVRLGIHQTP